MEALKALWDRIINNPWTHNDTIMTLCVLGQFMLFIIIILIGDYQKNRKLKQK